MVDGRAAACERDENEWMYLHLQRDVADAVERLGRVEREGDGPHRIGRATGDRALGLHDHVGRARDAGVKDRGAAGDMAEARPTWERWADGLEGMGERHAAAGG